MRGKSFRKKVSSAKVTPVLPPQGSAKGHEDQFLPPRLSARSVIRRQTVAATRGNGRDAPIPAVRRTSRPGGRLMAVSREAVRSIEEHIGNRTE
jgi:hypothetical protein